MNECGLVMMGDMAIVSVDGVVLGVGGRMLRCRMGKRCERCSSLGIRSSKFEVYCIVASKFDIIKFY